MYTKSQKHKQCPVVREMEKSTNSIWLKMGRRRGEQARLESRGCDDKGNKLALNTVSILFREMFKHRDLAVV